MIALDSSFLIGYYNERDAHHRAARAAMEDFLEGKWGQGLLLEYIFLEVVTVLVIRRDLDVARRVGRLLLRARELEFVPCSDLFVDALEFFTSQTQTRLSFADAALSRRRADPCRRADPHVRPGIWQRGRAWGAAGISRQVSRLARLLCALFRYSAQRRLVTHHAAPDFWTAYHPCQRKDEFGG